MAWFSCSKQGEDLLKNLALCFFALAIISNPALAKAEESNLNPPTQEDFAVVVDYFSRFVNEVNKPFYLYHWRSNPSLVQSEDVQLNPSKYGRQIIEREAPNFISGLYVSGRTNSSAYGGGLYAAVDPVVTESYGSGQPKLWVVLTTHIPKGFRILDLRNEQNIANTLNLNALQRSLSRFGCATNDGRTVGIDQQFQMESLRKGCADLIAKVITKLKIDGFLYGYSNTDYADCGRDMNRHAALVFTSKSWLDLPGADARVYTSRTRVDKDKRKEIESQFFYAYVQGVITQGFNSIDMALATREIQVKFPQQFRTMTSMDMDLSCTTAACTITMKIFSPSGTVQSEMQHEDLKSFYYTSYPTHFTLSNNQGPESLHWEDLHSEKTLPNIATWLQGNLFNCGSYFTMSKYPQ